MQRSSKYFKKNKTMKTITYTIFGITAVSPFIASACIESFGGHSGYGMMGYGGGAGFFMVAGGLVWVGVGILACVWLWQNINKK